MKLLHPKQKEVVQSEARFKIIRAGRRSGKTTLEIETMLFNAVMGNDRNVFYVAPTQKQARSIIWEALKSRVGIIGDANESRLEMKVPTKDGGKSHIFIAGWENRENFRGVPADHITFDETDTMRDFFIGWQEIFRPSLIDRKGTADFIGTPKKENPNLRRLEKESEQDIDWQGFHFTTYENPHIDRQEIETAKASLDKDTFLQEIMAEYVDNLSALFRYTALVDMFTNTVIKSPEKYLIVDVADDGSDKSVFAFWHGLELYRVDIYERLNTEGVVSQVRDSASTEQIPYSQIAVDAIGVGAGVASNSLLNGIIGFKSSAQAFRIDRDIIKLPNVHYTKDAPRFSEYRNLRSQCVFTLASLVNEHKIACRVGDVRIKERIIEELSLYQDVSAGDGRRMATQKEDIKALLGRSPDISDTLIMRMYFELREKLDPLTGEAGAEVAQKLMEHFDRNQFNQRKNSTK